MNIKTALSFNNITGMKMEEIVGIFILHIEAGSFCELNKNSPTNGLHHHNCFEMCIVVDGKGKFFHGGELYELGKGDVFIANPNIKHEISLITDTNSKNINNLYLIYFIINIVSLDLKPSETSMEKALGSFISQHSIICKSQTHLLAYLELFENYINKNKTHSYGFLQAVKNLAIDSLFSLVEDNIIEHSKQNPSSNIIDHAILYIGMNISKRQFLKEIAFAAHTSERNLQHLFKKHMNCTVMEYINQRKTSLAAGYIKMNFNIGDVCQQIGINDPAQFCRLFKKYYGVSPKKYQLLHSPSGTNYGIYFEK